MRLQKTMRYLLRHIFLNLYPPFRASGVRITHITPDFNDVHIELPLNWRTYNAVGTIFGGSMYAACDPWFMLIMLGQLPDDYIVWDKAATIYFKKPGKSKLHARFYLPPEEIQTVIEMLETEHSIDRTYTVDLTDKAGTVIATVRKVLYFRKGDRSSQITNRWAQLINWAMYGK